MKSGTIVKVSFALSIVLTVVACYLKLNHSAGADTWLLIVFIATFIFIISAIREIWGSKRIDRSEKILWTVAFLFFSGITALIYILIGRKKIAANF